MKTPMEVTQIIKAISKVEGRLHRSKLPFETGMLHDKVLEVVSYELIKSVKELTALIREMHPDKFGVKTVSAIHTPELDVHVLDLCPYCGTPGCTSDHK